jgi:hypothetical protein
MLQSGGEEEEEYSIMGQKLAAAGTPYRYTSIYSRDAPDIRPDFQDLFDIRYPYPVRYRI